jgi:murein DD-endopeptidase MepM/ murein hydrolase activator NlpD
MVMRRGLWGAATAVLLLSLPLPAHADDPTAARKGAQERANKAAARFAQAQSDLARAETGLSDLQTRVRRDEQRLGALKTQVQDLALREYMRGGTSVPLLFEKDINAVARARAMVKYVTLGDVQSIDRYRATRQDLAAASRRLNDQLGKQRAALASVQAEQKAAEADLNRLAAEEAKRAQEEAAANARTAPKPRAAPAAAEAASPAGTGKPTGQIATGPWVCPVQGPHSFSDDYGQPRNGGRSHQGNDILSPRGTPVVANVGGTMQQHPNGLGGLAYFLEGDDGKEYYGAHLDSFSGATGHVAIGTVIGYVGNTGDAAGGPTHLHFEIHPAGHTPTDPYPTLRQYC